MARTTPVATQSITVETLSDAMTALQTGSKTGKTVRLLFAWAHLRAVGIGYAMAIVAKARAAHPRAVCLSVLDAGDDAGLALSALKSGADLVLFCGAPQVAQKLAQIAAQLGVSLEVSPALI